MAMSREAAAPRRVLATRNAGWARALARRLAATGVSPNAISIASVVFALAAAAAFAMSPGLSGGGRVAAMLAAAACIQLRLLCNLLDGMLAVEDGLKSKTGEIFNELPDRLADVVILVGAGYAAPQFTFAAPLGWAAAALAVLTAYVRVLGGSLGLTQHFIGPMAKQHRMFTLTLARAGRRRSKRRWRCRRAPSSPASRSSSPAPRSPRRGGPGACCARRAHDDRDRARLGLRGWLPAPRSSGTATRTARRSASTSAITPVTSTSSSSGRRCRRRCGGSPGRLPGATTGRTGRFAAISPAACFAPC